MSNPEGGFINKELHREFWAPFIQKFGSLTAKNVADIRAMIDAMAGAATTFHRETWSSAILSARAGKVTYTTGYMNAQRRVRDLAVPPAQRGLLEQAAANGDRILEAAAARQPLQTKDKSIYITEDLANRIVIGLDGAIARLARLINPVWSETPSIRESRYDDLGIAILTDEPFCTRGSNARDDWGGRFAAHYAHSCGERGYSVNGECYEAPGDASNIDALLSRVATSAFNAIGATMTTNGIYQNFRGHRSFTAVGKASIGGRIAFISQRIVFRANRRTLSKSLRSLTI